MVDNTSMYEYTMPMDYVHLEAKLVILLYAFSALVHQLLSRLGSVLRVLQRRALLLASACGFHRVNAQLVADHRCLYLYGRGFQCPEN